MVGPIAHGSCSGGLLRKSISRDCRVAQGAKQGKTGSPLEALCSSLARRRVSRHHGPEVFLVARAARTYLPPVYRDVCRVAGPCVARTSMPDETLREPGQIRQSCARKLRPVE